MPGWNRVHAGSLAPFSRWRLWHCQPIPNSLLWRCDASLSSTQFHYRSLKFFLSIDADKCELFILWIRLCKFAGVFCRDGIISLSPLNTFEKIGVHAQVFTVVNDESYYYPDMIRGMIVDGEMGKYISKYTGSTTSDARSNTLCSKYTPITWQVTEFCNRCDVFVSNSIFSVALSWFVTVLTAYWNYFLSNCSPVLFEIVIGRSKVPHDLRLKLWQDVCWHEGPARWHDRGSIPPWCPWACCAAPLCQ